ncbi:MAG: hypothetical protein KBG47_03535 [Bacteroidia bacterium]|nr:hypothetical protein [Bacteroidia bacterium]
MKNVVIALIMMIGLSSFAQPGQRIAAKKCIRRTTVVIMHAQKKLKENKVYTGNMVKSVRHQRYARFLFRQGKFLRAIHQSRRARQLAFLVIQANKGTVEKGWELSKEENPAGAPTDSDLEKELPADTENKTDEKLAGEDLKDIDVEEKE